MINIENLQRIIGLSGTKTGIQSLTSALKEISFAVSTDTNELGIYLDDTWYWVAPSGATISGVEETKHIYNEDVTSQVSGYLFSTQNIYISGTLRVYYNGVRQRNQYDYCEISDHVTFSTYFPTYSGDVLIVDYDYMQSQQLSELSDSEGISLVDSDGILILDNI